MISKLSKLPAHFDTYLMVFIITEYLCHYPVCSKVSELEVNSVTELYYLVHFSSIFLISNMLVP